MIITSSKPTLTLRNAKSAFSGYLPSAENNIVCARLGQERNEVSELHCDLGHMSIAAHVRQGLLRPRCQDCAIVFINGAVMAAGVFDGFGPAGTAISEAVADRFIEVLLQTKVLPPNAARTILMEAAAAMRQTTDYSILYAGGTTATVAIVLPDGTFSAAAVADSALYVKRSDGIERHFDYSTVYVHDLLPCPATSLHFKTYFSSRNAVGTAINAIEISTRDVDAIEGKIAPGESLLLVTDGATKNLAVHIRPDTGRIRDNSGCEDLTRILDGRTAPLDLLSALLGKIDSRVRTSILAPGIMPVVGNGTALMPNADDVGIVAITLK